MKNIDLNNLFAALIFDMNRNMNRIKTLILNFKLMRRFDMKYEFKALILRISF